MVWHYHADMVKSICGFFEMHEVFIFIWRAKTSFIMFDRNLDTPRDGFLLCLFFVVILLEKILSECRTYRKGQAFHIEVVVRLNALTREKPNLSFRYQIHEWECDVRTTASCLSSRHRINAITQSFRDTIEFAHNAFYTFRSHSRDSSSFRIIGGNDRDVETWKKERAT